MPAEPPFKKQKTPQKDHEMSKYIITVFGASGDLSKKKTFPAIFGLFKQGELKAEECRIVGYARSNMTTEDLRSRLKPFLLKQGDENLVDKFLAHVTYVHGPYDEASGYIKLREAYTDLEKELAENSNKSVGRLHYLALPPSVFGTVCGQIKENLYEDDISTKIIVEKPFGHDLESSRQLQKELAPLFSEEELYRIDHYLGKEMVKNLLVLRFGNIFFNAAWNKENIQNIQITFKEPFGTEGRGGYFNDIGIIRDVMQNHLLQVLTLLTMERPVSFDAEAVRDEKVKVLKAIAPFDHNDIIIGQYGKSEDNSKPSYLDDETVPEGSKCITFAALNFKIRNERWDGVPIVMKAGKALDAGKVEIRIQFKQVASGIFNEIPNNELVIRVQPDEAVYFKCNMKTPGLSTTTKVTDLDLTYADRYKDFWIPQAYEALIRDALIGDHSNFVRDDELDVSWKLFTPLLNYLEGKDAPVPSIYPYGSRGPENLNEYMKAHGYVYMKGDTYTWPITRPKTE
ncbi:hypothetical protein QEN19_002291 [Hanseniaspora menglaensis]